MKIYVHAILLLVAVGASEEPKSAKPQAEQEQGQGAQLEVTKREDAPESDIHIHGRDAQGLLFECDPRDCDRNADCAAGLVCAEGTEDFLRSVSLHRNTAYCDLLFPNVDFQHEVCYDPTRADRFRFGTVAPLSRLGFECERCGFDGDCISGLLCSSGDVTRFGTFGFSPIFNRSFRRVGLRDRFGRGRLFRNSGFLRHGGLARNTGFLRNFCGTNDFVCYDPTLVGVGVRTTGFVRTFGFLGECQVDCDTDFDCAPSLICADEAVHEETLQALGLSTNTAYCRYTHSRFSYPYENEVCFDPLFAEAFARRNRKN